MDIFHIFRQPHLEHLKTKSRKSNWYVKIYHLPVDIIQSSARRYKTMIYFNLLKDTTDRSTISPMN